MNKIICDKCHHPTREAKRLCLTVDRYMDAAGSMDNDNKLIDTCINCLINAIYAARLDFETSEKICVYYE